MEYARKSRAVSECFIQIIDFYCAVIFTKGMPTVTLQLFF